MMSRILSLSKDKLYFIFFFLVVFVSVLYIYITFLQDHFKSIQSSESRCMSELASVRYQLNVVTEYKSRIDKLLSETQQAYEADKERLRDIMESCVAMKQQSTICQSQFEDLQVECKKVKENLNQISKDYEKFKTEHK